jgi:hypothetical protein
MTSTRRLLEHDAADVSDLFREFSLDASQDEGIKLDEVIDREESVDDDDLSDSERLQMMIQDDRRREDERGLLE